MQEQSNAHTQSQCLTCGHEAAAGEWNEVEAPPLGMVTQCPECGSTNVITGL